MGQEYQSKPGDSRKNFASSFTLISSSNSMINDVSQIQKAPTPNLWFGRLLLILALLLTWAKAGTLHINISHQFGDQPLTLNSLKYKASETLSVSRLSYLLSQLAMQKQDGSWLELPSQFALIDLGSRRTSFSLTQVPAGIYQAIRFSVGVPKETNHGDTAQYHASHPLNPNLNRLHWDWSQGYIFLALEGKYRTPAKAIKGFVYHLANDQNLSGFKLTAPFHVETQTALHLSFDLKKLLTDPSKLSFSKDGNSTHSHEGDPIAGKLVKNLEGTFAIRSLSYPTEEARSSQIKPLYLPNDFTPFPFKTSRRFPAPFLPRDNPLIEERVSLGRSLFHDPRLSRDGSVTCATCHQQSKAFTDGLPLSKGIDGQFGDRNSMPIFNLAWKLSFFWDGRAKSLREQVLEPIEDHREMAADLKMVVAKLEKSSRSEFEKAFGPGPVTEEKIALALESFLLTLTSYDSKFDQSLSGKAKLTEKEQRGMELFFTEYEPRSGQFGADCFHCHGGANFSDHRLHDNGLGGLFNTPSLRNLSYTGPYMHDGRFKSLEEVIAHYNSPIPQTETLDPNLAKHPKAGLQLTKEDQAALIAFLKSLNDPKYSESR